ncbi:peptidoglycan-binding domain-containing protein [Candidatus Arthromitus sp. SFB-rat-Yit]|uniref:peptidoglycan-binding domain-containing protein n=1 Tax=Candidatus Arthromitus sp. SFB-rat-Yit TaxID=1041504 RepID=UPI000227A379|nr:peptidoglycan-binding protein [Candidatus Arthromitus sp. SFB-rat-Yit]BAK80878.1 spore cortex-lytic enzyme, pre-pro-form [Candidatus Arthromitus sp. SFB-rat-Yit]
MEKGYLVFEIAKDNGATPVSNAQIKITNIDGREVNKILGVNEDGRSDEIEIYTKNINLTFDKSNECIPYTEVDAEVRFENDKIVEIKGIQVYSNTTSIQEVKFDSRDLFRKHHNKDKKSKSKKEHIYLKNETPCVFKSKDNDVKIKNGLLKDDNSIKPIVKSGDVCIPEFITIHLGEPNDNGEIITIPFVDYVKNVTCSTIYPTWNDEAIKANIYAIVSLSLNRIYTNWYRSKGYGFEVTSSPIYDQMYVKGRNLFRNVCNIVDDIFDKCIKVSGFNQPLLAKCDNVTSDYRVLSRWGSLRLAEDGLDALDILKKYFGDNIEIVEIPNIESIIKKYPDKELHHGNYGKDVKFIQKALNLIATKYPGVSKISDITGNFGDETEKSVKDFQKIFNLKVDGIVGEKTWKKISLVYSLIKRLFGDYDDAEEGMSNNRVLRLGSEGALVKEVQNNLNNILKYIPGYKKLDEDGIFGENTKRAVEYFQKVFGLVVDGIVGKNTFSRIKYVKENIESLQDFIENSVNKDSRIMYQRKEYEDQKFEDMLPIKYGDKGSYVEKLQKLFNIVAKHYHFLDILVEDGNFGVNMEEAIKNFQKRFALICDGILGDETLTKLKALKNAINNNMDGKLEGKLKKDDIKEKSDKIRAYREEENKLCSKSLRSEISMKYPGFELEFGDVCGYVTLAQQYINFIRSNSKGYFRTNVELKDDGVFGENTLSYINEFQNKFMFDITRKIDKNVWNRLILEYEKIYKE